jgi:hypothetical protein
MFLGLKWARGQASYLDTLLLPGRAAAGSDPRNKLRLPGRTRATSCCCRVGPAQQAEIV